MIYKSNLKEFKEWTWTKRIVYNLAVSLLLTLVLGVITIKLFNLRLDEVLSDSMYPVFSDQDVVVIKPQDEYKKGDIIEYKKGNAFVTHRVVDYNPETGIYTTKGEHHGAVDDATITKNMITGKVICIWENGRRIYHTIKDNYFLVLTIIVGAWVLSSTIAGETEMKKHNIMKI